MSSVLAEHLSYMQLPGRHKAYASAIALELQPGDTVADLGCGFGVLGLQCLQAGAGHVWGIDQSDAIEIARETVARQGLSDRYSCISDSTFRARLPVPVDLVICDHVGFFGIDYGIIEMLEDARRRMLKPGGAVLPRRIVLHVAGVSSDKCRNLAQGWSQEPVPPDFAWLDEYAANSLHSVTLDADELCSAEARLGEVRLDRDNPASLTFSTRIVVTRDCVLDGLSGWFECELAEHVWMTNSPLAPDSIGRPQAFLPFEAPQAVRTGEELRVNLRIRHDRSILAWSVSSADGHWTQRMSNWKSRILTDKDLETRLDQPLRLNDLGAARRIVLDLVDGRRSAREIEALVLERHPDLFASSEEIARFVRAELGNGAGS